MKPQRRAKRGSDDVGYMAAHARMYKARGKASEHLCSDCGKQARDWGLRDIANPKVDTTDNPVFRGKRFSLRADDYLPLCRSCNLRGDRSYDKGSVTVYADTVRSIASV